MQKMKLAICMEDAEYQARFTNYVFGHYKEQFELHGYQSMPQFAEYAGERGEQILLTDAWEEGKIPGWGKPVLYLTEDAAGEQEEQDHQIRRIEKYQDAGKIVESILKSVDDRIYEVTGNHMPSLNQKTLAVYSLAETEYQLPFVLTLASILGESQRTLVLDLQENSGLQQMFGEGENQGLEELMVMAKGGKFSKNRLLSCICRREDWDYVYPAVDTECICSMESESYFKILELICSEMNYDVILVNLGTRFSGFFEVLKQSRAVFFLEGQSGLAKAREHEFERELDRNLWRDAAEKMIKMEIPFRPAQVIPCERLVDEWKWNEFGDRIRRLVPEVTQIG